MSFPAHTSPSNLDLFKSCPKRWKWHYVEKRPAVTATDDTSRAVGSFVHSVLEELFKLPDSERTLSNARTVAQLLYGTLERSGQSPLPDKWDIWHAVEGLWDLEQPRKVDVFKREFRLSGEVLDGVKFLGFVDRLNWLPDGSLQIVDYKTGKFPAKTYRSEKLRQLRLYHFAYSQLHGDEDVGLLSLYYLGKDRLEQKPTAKDLKRTSSWLRKSFDATVQAYENDEFPAKPSGLCGYCPYLDDCEEGLKYERERRSY